ncbi:MAG: hypothetical protein JWO45_629, partial [Spartobacteria bacterium]|nr:hypothetical protein [Spartobacteria bacterium]
AGYETEINLNVTDWLSQIAGKLKCGFVLAIDYGFVRREFYSPHRTAGTLQCRAHHRLLASAFEAIGESDISAHVDWTGLAEDAEANGLRLSGFSDQHHFLTGIVSAWPHLIEGANPKTRRTLQTLLHPEMLGRMFQVFALSKAVDSTSGLSGFKFAKDARRSLGV